MIDVAALEKRIKNLEEALELEQEESEAFCDDLIAANEEHQITLGRIVLIREKLVRALEIIDQIFEEDDTTFISLMLNEDK